MDGTNKTMSNVSEINDFETFIKTLGIGNSNFDRDLAVDNGAFMINYITKIVSGGKKKA